MMEFLRPGTRVWIGDDLLTPATICAVTVVREGTCYYHVDWWRDGLLQQAQLERFEFSTQQGATNPDHEPAAEESRDAL